MANLRELLEEVRATAGALTPTNVLEAARPADSPLHRYFEWDDAVAAEAHRVAQARELIRSVKVRYKDSEGAARDVRGFVSISRPDVPQREYVPVEEAAADPVLRQLVRQEMEREWRTLLARAKDYDDFLEAMAADIAAAKAA